MRLVKLNIILIITFFISVNVIGQLDATQDRYFRALYHYDQQQNDSALIELEYCGIIQACQILKAKIYYESGDFLKAINEYKNLFDENPAESSFKLSLIYAEMGFVEESIDWLKKYFEHKEPRYYSRIIENKEFENISNTQEWRDFWAESRYAKNYEKFEEAEYLISQEKLNEAIKLLNNIETSPRNYHKNYLLSSAYFKEGDLKTANKYADISIGVKPKSVDAQKLKVEISKAAKDYSTCYNLNSNLLKIDKFNPEHILRHAEICFLMSNYEEAERYIKAYVKFFPNDEDAVFLKAKILVNTESFVEALISLNSLIEKDSSSTDYFALRADIYYSFESWNFAANDYSMILDIDPNSSEAYYKMGLCYFKLNQPEKACYVWKKAANMRNKDAKRMLNKYCEY